MAEKMTDAEMRLFALGTALCTVSPSGARIIASALHEMQGLKRRAKKKPARRNKRGR